MLDVFTKKQMYVSVIMGKENASEDWNCLYYIDVSEEFQYIFCVWLCMFYMCMLYDSYLAFLCL